MVWLGNDESQCTSIVGYRTQGKSQGVCGLVMCMSVIPRVSAPWYCLCFFATGKLMLVSLYMVSSFQGFSLVQFSATR